jgi:hypothetical protein
MRVRVEVNVGERQRGIVTYAVLAGLTPLIPIPILDDLAKNYFRKRLVRSVASDAGRRLSEEEVDALSAEQERGCLTGCLLTALVYPLKAVFRKLFYFLEWKRAADLTSRTYHFGYLTSYAVRPRDGGASALDLCGAEAVGSAIQAVCREAPIKPLEAAVGGTFRQSRRALKGAAALLSSALRRVTRGARDEQVAEALQSVEPAEERELDPVVTRLQRSIANVPEEHFRSLRQNLDARLGLPTEI